MMHKIKSKINRTTITALLFLAILAYYFIGMLINYPQINKTVTAKVNAARKNAVVSNQTEEEETEEALPTSSTDGKILKVMKAFISGTDAALNTNIYNKLDLIDLNGLFCRSIGKKIIEETNANNTVYKMTNGQLTYLYPAFGVRIAHKNIKVLKQYLDTVGTQLLYIQAPYKVDKYNNELPHNMVDYPNQNADNFLAGLDKLGIDYIDFREVFHNEGFVYKDLFFNTDHHWTTETGFYAYSYTMEYLKEHYGFDLNERNIEKENFSFVTLNNSFIGSLANRVGKYYAGLDDFTYIYPNFETSYTWTKYLGDGTKSTHREGDFMETVLFKERVEGSEPQAYRDNLYFNGNPAIAKIVNNDVSDGNLLVVQDSFGKPLSAFFSLNFHHVDVMDLRDYKEKYLLDYIKENEYKYDYVIILYNPSALKRSTYYQQFHFYDYK